MSNVIDCPEFDQHSGSRLNMLHVKHPPLFDLPENLGSPDDWLHSAMQHLGLQSNGTGWNGGTVEVSKAAVSLVLMKLEQLLYDGPPVSIRPVD